MGPLTGPMAQDRLSETGALEGAREGAAQS